MADRNLRIKFESDATQLKQDIAQLSRDSQEFKAGLTGVAVAAGIVSATTIGLGKAALATGGQVEQLLLRLQTTLGSKGAAETAFKSIQAFSVATPFQVSEVTNAFLSLKNRGIEPTNDVLGKLGDLASSQSKPLQQVIEGILDASVGSNERLVELGIQAQQVGDKVRFTFKGVSKEVEKTPSAITEAIVSFGALKGVMGGMELQAISLTGKLSNLTDSTESVSVAFFKFAGEPVKAVVTQATNLINTFLALPAPLQNAIFATGILAGALATLTVAVVGFELANGKAVATQTLATLGLIKDTAQTNINAAAKLALALATGTATESQKALAIATALNTAAFVGVAATVIAVADSYIKTDAAAAKLRSGTQSVNDALTALDELQATTGTSAEKAAANINLEAAALKRTSEEVGGFQRALDLVRDAIPGVATSVESSINRQKVAFGDLITSADNVLSKFDKLKAKGLSVASKEELEAEKKAIDAAIASLTASINLDPVAAANKDIYLKSLNRSKTEIEAQEKATKDLTEATKKNTDAVAEQIKAYTQQTTQIAQGAEERRAILFESLLAQGQDAEAGNAQLLEIEANSARDRLNATFSALDKLSALKTSEKDPKKLEQINAEITKLEGESIKGRIDIAKSGLTEVKRIEDERLKSIASTEQKAFDAVKNSTDSALRVVKQSESDRLIATQTALNQGIITEEQANSQRLDSKRRLLNDELFATTAQIAKLEALPKFSDPEREKARLAEIQQAREKLSGLTLTLLESEFQKQQEHKRDIIKGIEERRAVEQDRSDAAIAGYNREQQAIDAILAASDRQNQLLQSRAGVETALGNLEQVRSRNTIANLTRAGEIRKQLDDDTEESAATRAQLERELAQLTGQSGTKALDIILRRQTAEDALITQQQKARLAEQEAARIALENEIARNKLLADRALIEARIAELRSRQQFVDASAGLQDAKISGDKRAIADAEELLGLAGEGVTLGRDNVRLSQQSVADQTGLAANSRQQLSLEQQAANEGNRAANFLRESAQSEELVRAGGSAASNRFVGGLIPKISPLTPTIQNTRIPDSQMTRSVSEGNRGLENQVKEVLTNMKAIAAVIANQTPPNVNVNVKTATIADDGRSRVAAARL